MTDGGIRMGMTPPHPGAFIQINATFDEAVDVLTQPVRIRYIDHPRRER